MKVWIGRWLVAVAIVHTGFAVFVFAPDLGEIVRRGFFNVVAGDMRLVAVTWFVLFGAVLFIVGLAVTALERSNQAQVPASVGWSLLALALLGIALMPASGFYLVLVPAMAVVLKSRRAGQLRRSEAVAR